MKRRFALTLAVLACCLALMVSTPSGAFSILQKLTLQAAQAFTPLPAGAKVCGSVSSYLPATGASIGSLTIGGVTYPVAAGFGLNGVQVGSDQCFSFCFDNFGRINRQDGNPALGQNLPQVCGIVTSFSPSLGGVTGAVTIGGAKFRIAPGLKLTGQEKVAPGANTCLVFSNVSTGDLAGAGSIFYQSSSPKQVRIAQVVHGTILGSGNQDDIFALPQPMILSLDNDQATVFTVGPQTFGRQLAAQAATVEGFSLSTANSAVQGVACTDSLWDGEMQIASSGATDGDTVTLNLLNPDKSVAQQLAVFSLANGGATLSALHPDVKVKLGGNDIKGIGQFMPFWIWAGSSGYRTSGITLALSPSSRSFNGCFQFAVEIKKANGNGPVSVVFDSVTVKRMETPNDRYVSIASGLTTGSIGWFPTGRVCEFVCWACPVIPPPLGGISGYVYCDTNNDGVKDSGEGGLGNVVIKLLNSAGQEIGQAQTNGDGFYQFSNLIPGTYGVMEVQPGSGVSSDGKDTAGSCGGVAGNDMITSIVVAQNSACTNNNFGELCIIKCATFCWRTTQYWISNSRYLPGGTVLISGVNANNSVSIQQNLPAVRQALQGGSSAMQRINKEYVTAQISMAAQGGSGSPVVFNTFWSALSCSNVSFPPVTLSNGVTLSPASLLDTLNTQTVLAIKENRHADMFLLADIWALLNGQCGQ